MRRVRSPLRVAPPTLLRVDSGVPHTSKRAGSRTGSGGVVKPPKNVDSKGNGVAKTNGSTRKGPVDPRTEDPSSPNGLSRAGKTVWRRPGASTPRTAKHREAGSLDAPIEFSLALPLAEEATEALAATNLDTVSDAVTEREPIALRASIESV